MKFSSNRRQHRKGNDARLRVRQSPFVRLPSVVVFASSSCATAAQKSLIFHLQNMTHLRHRLRRYNRFTLSLKVMATSPALIRSFYFACFTTGLFTFLFLLMFVERPKQVIYYTDRQQPPPPSSSPIVKSDRIRDKFAIYSCTTPSTTAAIKDYAYYLVS